MSYRIDIDPSDPKSIERALKTEWLLTNGLGGYAMGTALGVNTRRYHGLLVAATKPPVGRVVALHSMIEQLVIPKDDGSEEIIDLSTQQFVGPPPDGQPMLHPSGFTRMLEFECKPEGFARWQYECIDTLTFSKGIQFFEDWPGCSVLYSARWKRFRKTRQRSGYRVRARPLFALRDFHSLYQATASEPSLAVDADHIIVQFNGFRAHFTLQPDSRFVRDPQTWRGFHYESDRLRGQDHREQLWSPGWLEFSISQHLDHNFECWVQTDDRQQLIVNVKPPMRRPLESAAAQFVAKRQHGEESATTILAGYPWFGDWGRDTMIALPGLMLCTGRIEEARSTLLTFARNLRNGLIPNLFDDYGGGAHYNSIDASLWFVHAVHALLSPSPRGRGEADTELLAACRAIIAAYRHGTDFNIRMDDDGLIAGGDEGSQLTWMDAKRDGVVFTPRHGKAVEINALWHNALRCFAALTDDAERDELLTIARRTAESFQRQFWWDERGCLHDVLIPRQAASGGTEYAPDYKLRPNQIFAVSLPHSPLDESQQRAVVKIVGERLLTPFGLRTLDRDDPGYKGRYEGNLFERDAAYHNGTVWPWLIGPYCEALLRVEQFSDDAKQRVRAIIQPLIDEMKCARIEQGAFVGGCLGQIAEVYDGDPPHRPGGCPAQAWSVGEVLRILKMIESE